MLNYTVPVGVRGPTSLNLTLEWEEGGLKKKEKKNPETTKSPFKLSRFPVNYIFTPISVVTDVFIMYGCLCGY